jgi:hypothetical protein
MKKTYVNKNKSGGYALLFTMVIVSVIMVIATGISSSISKQLILSATASSSQIAFYEADTAIECALYASQVIKMTDFKLIMYNNVFSCGQDQKGNIITLDVTEQTPLPSGIYDITPSSTLKGPCFSIRIDESTTPKVAQAYGYNVCDVNNKNRVERGIKVEY